MKVEVNMPKLGMTMTEGTILKWFKAEGDEIKEGEIIAEIESDKVSNELEAPATGIVEKLYFEEGSEVPVGDIIAIIEQQ